MCAGFVRITYLSLMIYLSSSCSIGGRREEIILHPDGGYDFMVSINKDVPEERELITKLQEYIHGASQYLLTATEGRMYFRNVTILIPKTWSDQRDYTEVQGRSFTQARMLIESGSEDSYVKPIYTVQPSGCGEEGDYIRMAPRYVKDFDLLPQPFHEQDWYKQYTFDPYGSGDFDFAEALLNKPGYSTGLVLYLTALEKQNELYPSSDGRDNAFQHMLWANLMKQIIGDEKSQQITDQYEVWDASKQQSNQTKLSDRLTRLHEYKTGRDVSSSFNVTSDDVMFRLTNQTASNCMQSLYSSEDFVYCEISSSRYPPQNLIEELLLNSERIYNTSSKAGRCSGLLRSVPRFITSCMIESSGLSGSDEYQTIVSQSVELVKSLRNGNQSVPSFDPTEFESVDVKQFDTEYSRVIYGASEKRLVREWAHLRWGLFDENPQDDDPAFYTVGEELRPTGCPVSVKGRIHDSGDWKKGCSINSETGLPESSCVFDIDESVHSTKSSLMYAEYLPSVTKFCTSESLDTDLVSQHRLHDPASPNHQNKRCSERSVWEVLSTHSDFATQQSAKARAPNTVFTLIKDKPVLQNSSYIVCLALDTSGSMGGDRIANLATTVRHFISYYVSEGTYVGIVQFNSNASTLAGMTLVRGQTERDNLLRAVPTTAGGGTSIGAGIQQCQQMLKGITNNKPAGTYIMLLSDGVEGSSPYIKDVLPDLTRDGIILNTIAYSQNADTGMADASAATGGQAFFAADNDAIADITSALLSTVKAAGGDDCSIVTIRNEKVTLGPGKSNVTKSVNVDESIKDTQLTFIYTDSIIVTVTVRDHASATLKRTIPVIPKTAIKTITADISGVMNGEVEYTIKSVNPQSTPEISVTITAQPVETEEPITIESKSDISTIIFNHQSMVDFYVTIMKGVVPVSGIDVTATVKRPSGDSVQIKLLDNGAGADSTKGDGIYSGLLNANQLEGNGYYDWKVDVSGSPLLKNEDKSLSKNLTAITRNTDGGSLQVSKWKRPTEDLIAPETVRDLVLLTAIEGTGIATVGWTAPGDDPGFGIATGYEIVLLTSREEIVNSSYLKPNSIVWTSDTRLEQEAGVPVQYKINTSELLINLINREGTNSSLLSDLTGEDNSDLTYFIRLRAFDERNNTADWSNIVSASFLKPEIFSNPIWIDGDNYAQSNFKVKENIFEELESRDIAIANVQTTSIPATGQTPEEDNTAILAGSISAAVVLMVTVVTTGLVIRYKMKTSYNAAKAASV